MAGPVPRIPVTFAAEDGAVLRGERVGDGTPALLLVHESGLDLDAWDGAPERFAAAGFRVLAFDRRGHGASDGAAAPEHLASDVLAAIAELGASPGATVVVGAGDAAPGAMAAAMRAGAAGIVLISPTWPAGPAPPSKRVVLSSLVIIDRGSRASLEAVGAVQATLIGWRMVVHAGTDDAGTAMLAGAWGAHAEEHIRAFARQAARSRLPRPGGAG